MHSAAKFGLAFMLLALTGRGHATESLIASDAPYWEVGPRDKALSAACALGLFNTRQSDRFTVNLHAKAGGGAVLGVAKGTGLNLYDPNHRAKASEDYFFRYDGTSNCEVFVGGRTQPVPAK